MPVHAQQHGDAADRRGHNLRRAIRPGVSRTPRRHRRAAWRRELRPEHFATPRARHAWGATSRVAALAQHRNFTLAARASHMAQPTIHRGARELERLLEVPLFEKTSYGVVPTSAAEFSRGASALHSRSWSRRAPRLLP